MKNKILKIIFVSFLLVFPVLVNAEQERIKLFDSNIEVNKDASLTVTETISVFANGDQIVHGIYRDFPTTYEDEYGNKFKVSFEVQEVSRDGESENYWMENISDGKRIYIGDKNTKLKAGDYSFLIKYKTNRQIGYFEDHDELYWNVTGNFWNFPIDKATASVKLPSEISADKVKLDGFTGPIGSKEKKFTKDISGGTIKFQTAVPLSTGEGLTVVVGWPKGFVYEPTKEERMRATISDNIVRLISIIGLLATLLYYFIIWSIKGRDPAKGTIIPQYEPPEDLTPASLRYLAKQRFDKKCFTAAILDMAVRGHLKIEEKKSFFITKINSSLPLLREDKIIDSNLGLGGSPFELSNENYKDVQKTENELRKTIIENYYKKHFVNHYGYLSIGILLSLLFIFINFLSETPSESLFLSLWLLFWTIGLLIIAFSAIKFWRTFIQNKNLKSFFAAFFMSLFAVPFLAAEVIVIYILSKNSFYFLFIALLSSLMNFAFYFLLKVRTKFGRNVMDKIEGFKWFLSVTEKDRMNFHNPPNKTPELFEKFLPYALALEVENKWAEQFASVLNKIGPNGETYHPIWYIGPSWSSANPGTFASSMGNSLNNSIVSASAPPGSSSGFSGGFSGGGGGGGGGGGW